MMVQKSGMVACSWMACIRFACSWMFDGVDIHTTWNELRALPNRSQAATLEQIKDVEEHLPFPLQGMDSDNGGEFINHHLVRYLQQRSKQ